MLNSKDTFDICILICLYIYIYIYTHRHTCSVCGSECLYACKYTKRYFWLSLNDPCITVTKENSGKFFLIIVSINERKIKVFWLLWIPKAWPMLPIHSVAFSSAVLYFWGCGITTLHHCYTLCWTFKIMFLLLWGFTWWGREQHGT